MEICLGAAEVKSQPRDSSASLTPIQLSYSPYSRFVSGKKIDFTCNSRGHEMEEEFANYLPSTLRTEFPYFSVPCCAYQRGKKLEKDSKPHFLPPLLGPTSVADLVALEWLKTTILHRAVLRHTAILPFPE